MENLWSRGKALWRVGRELEQATEKDTIML
jgi:hypothetical protein